MHAARLVAGALLLAGLAGCPAATVTGGPGPGHTVAPQGMTVTWKADLHRTVLLPYRPTEKSRPALDLRRDRLYVADRLGKVQAVEDDGSVAWRVDVGSPVEAGLVLADDRLYVATTDGVVLALDPTTGASLWRYQGSAELATAPTLAGSRLLVPSLSNTVVALDAASGEFLWFHRRTVPADLTIRGAAGVAVAGGRAVTAYSDGTVVALDLETGEVLWARTFGASGEFVDIDTTPVVVDDKVLVVGFDGELRALSLADGTVQFGVSGLPGTVSLARAGDRVVLASPQGAEARRLSDGGLLWKARLAGGVPATLEVGQDAVFVATSEGPLYALDLATGRPTSAFAPGRGVAAAPVADGRDLWVWSNGGVLYRVRR